MNKKLEIGDEIVIYPEKKHSYESPEISNGCKDQAYNSSNFPETLTAVFIGGERGKDGKWYQKYTLKSIPKELSKFELYGKLGIKNSIRELNRISKLLQGTAEDGRKILYSRSINVEDVNEILGVVVDYKNKRIYQKDYPSKNINEVVYFGERRQIRPSESRRCSSVAASEFIEDNKIKSTAYRYSIKDLKISEKQKEIIQLNVGYNLASRSVRMNLNFITFCKGFVYDDGIININGELFNSYGYESVSRLAVRPVFYLESNLQSEVIRRTVERKIKEQQKKIEDMQKDIIKQEEKIAKMQENLNKEEKKLEEMMEEALKLV